MSSGESFVANPGILETTELYLFNSRLLPARISIFDQNQEAEIFKFRWCRQSEFKNQLNLTSKILTRMLHIAHIFIFSFLVFEKKNCEFAELRLNGLFRKVVVISNLQ